jgi:quercetin dioxygenase-like cupin family protein
MQSRIEGYDFAIAATPPAVIAPGSCYLIDFLARAVQWHLPRAIPFSGATTMLRTLLLLSIGIALGIGGMTFAGVQEDGESVRIVAEQDIKEKLDGKDAKVSVVEVIIEPGKAGLPHRHPGPGFVCVLEGEYELGIDDQPTKRFKAGETFYEPTGCLHRVSKNPAAKGRTRLIAFVLHPRDAHQVAIPEHGEGEPSKK